MKLPPFSEFKESLDVNKLTYDVEIIAHASLREPNENFTKDQYLILEKIIFAETLSILQQYHSWLSEKLLS